MTTWFTADHHFGHANIIKYCNRPFGDVNDMDEIMIMRWNEVVRPGDVVYHLGDFTLGGEDQAERYFSRLIGKIYVVPGGHDKRWVKTKKYLYSADHQLVSIMPPLVSMHIESHLWTMCHYPMRSWEKSHYGCHHLHGHCHGTIGTMDESGDVQMPPNQKRGKRLDVGVDCHQFYPLRLQDVVKMLS